MKKPTSLYTLFFLSAAIIVMHACKKDEQEDTQNCKTCTARNKVSEVLIKTQEVCSATDEENFKKQYNPAEVIVICR